MDNFVNIFIKIISKHKKLLLILFLSLFKELFKLVIKIKNAKNINKNEIKICVCTVGKQENNYIKEFIEYYKNYGVDKIFLYDNNNINGESFDDIISEYTKINFVNLMNFRGQYRKQYKIYQDCYNNNYKKYDWLIFYDIDEYINLKNFKNIKDYLNQKKFNKCNSIYLNWIIHTDNNLIYYDNRTLCKRFPKIIYDNSYCYGKTIIRGNLKGINIKSCHLLDKGIQRCNGFGKIYKYSKIRCNKSEYNDYYYIDHYMFKSTEEFMNKINRGDCLAHNNMGVKMYKISLYLRFNEIKKGKMIYLMKHLNTNKV